MSIFGKLDAMNIPNDPFFVKEGEYPAVVTDIKFKDSEDRGRKLIIEYTIDDETSQYNGFRVGQVHSLVDPELTEEAFELLPATEKQKIIRDMSNTKKALCGSDTIAAHTGLGVNPDDLNSDDWDPTTLKGTRVDLAVNNFGEKNERFSVRWANLRD